MLNNPPTADEVDQLLVNAQLRTDLEPFYDEAVGRIDARNMPTDVENEFLASMLAWERAPVLPVSEWFQPELRLPAPETLDDQELSQLLMETIHRLYEKRIVLQFTGHLSDRQLYCVLYRDILPSHEKKIDLPRNYLHWHCLDVDADPETWLTYYASKQERREWIETTGGELPPTQAAPYPRKMPMRPL